MQQTPHKPDRRNLLVLIGGALALVAGMVIGWTLLASGRGERTAPPPASQAGLVIDSSGAGEDRLDTAKPLRCFVAGRFVGEFTLAECARRNGVATGALDVGIDETGALAAAEQASAMLTPLPPPDAQVPEAAPDAMANEPQPTPTAAGCWRYSGGQWRRLPEDMDLNACVRSLFAGRCERPGHASYGRWGAQTLRLVTGKVEVSGDNQNFQLLAPQDQGCSIPAAG